MGGGGSWKRHMEGRGWLKTSEYRQMGERGIKLLKKPSYYNWTSLTRKRIDVWKLFFIECNINLRFNQLDQGIKSTNKNAKLCTARSLILRLKIQAQILVIYEIFSKISQVDDDDPTLADHLTYSRWSNFFLFFFNFFLTKRTDILGKSIDWSFWDCMHIDFLGPIAEDAPPKGYFWTAHSERVTFPVTFEAKTTVTFKM